MLTDEQIKALLEDCKSDKGKPWLVHLWKSDLSAKVVADICTRLLAAEARVKRLEEALREIAPDGDSEGGYLQAVARAALQEQESK